MSDLSPEALSSHAVARAEIDAWRGRCLDLYARAETAVGLTLIKASAISSDRKLGHLAGQRLTQLEKIAEAQNATKKQRDALIRALEGWRTIESYRFFLAHGAAQELIDRSGRWHVQFDAQAYKAQEAKPERLNLSEAEAIGLEKDLAANFKVLTSQLGQFRKRLTA